MSHMNLWSAFYKDIVKISSGQMTNAKKDEIVIALSSPINADDYNIHYMLNMLSPKINDQEYYQIGMNILNNRTISSGEYDTYNLVERCAKIDKKAVKIVLCATKTPVLNRALLTLDPNLEEEVKGLRGCANTKYFPDVIFKKGYRPSLEALKKLPTIMRLNVIYSLTFSTNYTNVFENLPREELETLLFPSMTKYPDKIREILEKYDEIRYRGQDSAVRVSGSCEKCGPYIITLETKIIRTESSMGNTYLGRNLLLNKYCPLCYATLQTTPQFENISE